MNYDEYTNILSYFSDERGGDKSCSIEALSSFLDKPKNELLAFVEYLSSLGCPIKLRQDDLFFLTDLFDVYSKIKIEEACRVFGEVEVFVFLSIDSTNTYLKSLKIQNHKLLVCISEQQRQGRGRRGKDWVSPFGANLYLSLRKRIHIDPRVSGCVSLVVGLAIIKGIESLGVVGLKLKWPNDIYAGHEKLAGILIDVVSINAHFIELVIGVGVNVKMPSTAAQNIEQPWVDLQYLFTKEGCVDSLPSRTEITISLIRQICLYLGEFEVSGFRVFHAEWEKYDLLLNREITVKQENSSIVGTAVGITEAGELRLRDESGIRSINAGEVSVRLSCE